MIDTMRALDGKIETHAKLEPIIRELRALVNGRRPDMLRQSYRGCESALSSLEAAYAVEKAEAQRKCADHAKQGEPGPGRVLRVVE